MTMRESPWFPFDVLAWRSSRRVQAMDPATRGLYLEMLIEQWDHGAAPSTPETCAAAMGFAVEMWRAGWPQLADCFSKRGAKLINLRLDRTRRERLAFLADQRARGSLGGKARAQKQAGGKQPPRKRSATHSLASAKQSPKRSPSQRSQKDQKAKDQGAAPPTFAQAELADDRTARDRATLEPADDGNYRVILKLAYAVLRSELYETWADAIDAVKSECAKARIDYGRDPRVGHDVVVKAISSAAHRLGYTALQGAP